MAARVGTQSMMFPTVTSSAAGAGVGEGEREGEKAQGSGSKEKKKRREGREGRERREGRRARGDSKDGVREAGGVDDEGCSLDCNASDEPGASSKGRVRGEWEAPESPRAADVAQVLGGDAGVVGARSLEDAERMRSESSLIESSLIALGGELPWGHDDMQGVNQLGVQVRGVAGQPATGPIGGAAQAQGGQQVCPPKTGAVSSQSVISILDQPGAGGSQALYEMFKAAADSGMGEAGWKSPRHSPRRGGNWAMTNLKLEEDVATVAPGASAAASSSPDAKATGEGDDEAWAAGIDRWVGGYKQAWVDLQ